LYYRIVVDGGERNVNKISEFAVAVAINIELRVAAARGGVRRRTAAHGGARRRHVVAARYHIAVDSITGFRLR